MGSRIAGSGVYLPKNILDNSSFLELTKTSYSEKFKDLFDGCKYRGHASTEETTVLMGVEAAKNAMHDAKVTAKDIDFVLWASVAGDNFESQDAGQLMQILDINATNWVIGMGCSSFLPTLTLGDMLIKNKRAKKILIVSVTNWVNRIIDKTRDYSSLGDAAAAIILEESDTESLLSVHEQTNIARVDDVVLRSPWRTGKMEVIEFCVTDESRRFFADGRMAAPARRCLLDGIKQGVRPQWTIFSQPGKKAIKTWSQNLEMDENTNLNTLEFTGHLSTANHPFILHHFTHNEPKIMRGDILLFFGVAIGGYTGSILWQY